MFKANHELDVEKAAEAAEVLASIGLLVGAVPDKGKIGEVMEGFYAGGFHSDEEIEAFADEIIAAWDHNPSQGGKGEDADNTWADVTIRTNGKDTLVLNTSCDGNRVFSVGADGDKKGALLYALAQQLHAIAHDDPEGEGEEFHTLKGEFV